MVILFFLLGVCGDAESDVCVCVCVCMCVPVLRKQSVLASIALFGQCTCAHATQAISLNQRRFIWPVHVCACYASNLS